MPRHPASMRPAQPRQSALGGVNSPGASRVCALRGIPPDCSAVPYCSAQHRNVSALVSDAPCCKGVVLRTLEPSSFPVSHSWDALACHTRISCHMLLAVPDFVTFSRRRRGEVHAALPQLLRRRRLRLQTVQRRCRCWQKPSSPHRLRRTASL